MYIYIYIYYIKEAVTVDVGIVLLLSASSGTKKVKLLQDLVHNLMWWAAKMLVVETLNL